MKKSLAVVALSALISLASNVVFADDAVVLPTCVEKSDGVSLPTGLDGSCTDSNSVVHTFKDGKEVEANKGVEAVK